MQNFQAKRPLNQVLSDVSCLTCWTMLSLSPHWTIGQPACIALLVSTVVGGQELIWRGYFSPNLITRLSGLLKSEGVAAGCITIMEHHPCKTPNNSFMNCGSCCVLCEARWQREEEEEKVIFPLNCHKFKISINYLYGNFSRRKMLHY